MIALHQFLWKPSYTIKPGIEFLVDTLTWKNEKCNKHFSKKRDENERLGMKFIEYPSKEFP